MWSFKCVDGVTVEYNSISGQRPVLCETNFPLPSKSNTYSFLATSQSIKPETISMTVTQWDNEIKTSKASGSTSLQIVPEGYVETSDAQSSANTNYEPALDDTEDNNTVTNNSRNTSSNNSRVVDYTNTRTNYSNTQIIPSPNRTSNTGISDLRVTLVKVGRVMSDGSYQGTSAFAEDDRVVVVFNVANIGTARSGNWTLRADLPTKTVSDKVYISGTQPSIAPGDSYEMTISFDTFDPNGRNIIISLNAGDNNQSNNVLTIPVSFNGDRTNNTINNNYNSTGSRADLVTTITGVGIMGSNNQFYTSSNIYSGDKVAVRFTIQNLGDTASGSYRFTVDLPTEDGDTYTSNLQPSLAPGETKEFIIGYDNPQTGTNRITIKSDSDNDIRENGESNNTDTESVRVNN
jgi:hypothetical protein